MPVLNPTERRAALLLSKLRYDKKTGNFKKCRLNDFILKRAQKILSGRDPVNFMHWVLWDTLNDYDDGFNEFFRQIGYLKGEKEQ